MNQNQPLVSILLPICNAEAFLKESLKSLLAQSYKQIEIIAIDDSSKDASYKILQGLKKKDTRIRAYKNKKRYGMAVCLNRAVRKAKGSFIALFDQNDSATTDKIKRQVSFLLSHPNVAAVGTQTLLVNEKNKKIGKATFPTHHKTIIKGLLAGISMQFETAMINRRLLPKDLLSFKHNGSAMLFSDLFLKLLSYGEIANLPWALQYRRITQQNKSSLAFFQMIKLWITSFANYDYRLPFHTLYTPLLRQE